MKRETLNLKLTAMTQGGEAMGRDAAGRVVFVPDAIAGEEVIVEIVEAKKNFARARLVAIVTASPARVTPRCAHFAAPLAPALKGTPPALACGGCQWQHIAYPAQLRFKTEIVREQFARLAKMPATSVRETIGMREPWQYRNHAQFQLDAAGRLCFRAYETHDLVPIRECHLLHPLLNEMFRELDLAGMDFAGVTMRAGINTGQKLLILEGHDAEPPEIEVDEPISIAYQTPDGDTFALIGKDALHEELRGHAFRVSPQAFFQVNTLMAETLIDLVERYLAPQPGDVLLDAFGGVGTFGLALAPRVARVIVIEENPFAVNDAKANAVEIEHAEIQRGKVEEILPKLKTKIDLVVIDPPRAGIAPAVLATLSAHVPRAIAYVSCDPATLARDARQLVDNGYHLLEVQPVDLFPQTYHIESVSWFQK